MDWIDIPIQVPWVEYQKLKDLQLGKSSTTVQVRMGDFGVRFLWFNRERLGETITRAGPILINTGNSSTKLCKICVMTRYPIGKYTIR